MENVMSYDKFFETANDDSIIKLRNFDGTLIGKVLNVLFQEGACDMKSLVELLKKKSNGVMDPLAPYEFVRTKVMEYMSNEYEIIFDKEEIQDPNALLFAVLNIIVDLNARRIVDELSMGDINTRICLRNQ